MTNLSYELKIFFTKYSEEKLVGFRITSNLPNVKPLEFKVKCVLSNAELKDVCKV